MYFSDPASIQPKVLFVIKYKFGGCYGSIWNTPDSTEVEQRLYNLWFSFARRPGFESSRGPRKIDSKNLNK